MGFFEIFIDFIDELGEPEICDLDRSLVEQNIRRLDVTMHDSDLMAVLGNIEFVEGDKSRCDLFRDGAGFFLRKSLFGLHELLKIASIAIIDENVEIIGGPLHVDEMDDMLSLNLPQNVDFSHEQLVLLVRF